MVFKSSVGKGDVICITTKVAYVGKTSIVVYGKIHSETKDIFPVEGFITFVHVDLDGKKQPHGLVMDEPCDAEDLDVRQRALALMGF